MPSKTFYRIINRSLLFHFIFVFNKICIKPKSSARSFISWHLLIFSRHLWSKSLGIRFNKKEKEKNRTNKRKKPTEDLTQSSCKMRMASSHPFYIINLPIIYGSSRTSGSTPTCCLSLHTLSTVSLPRQFQFLRPCP